MALSGGGANFGGVYASACCWITGIGCAKIAVIAACGCITAEIHGTVDDGPEVHAAEAARIAGGHHRAVVQAPGAGNVIDRICVDDTVAHRDGVAVPRNEEVVEGG